MLIVGLTGGIGTGKTTVAVIFRRLGAVIIDADEIAHCLIEPNKPAWKKIVRYFGKGILRHDYCIDRKILGDKVFSSRQRLKKLCGIIHPLVYREIRGRITRIKKADPSAMVVMDVPLLLETGGEKYVDKLIVVTAPRYAQIKRACRRFGLSRTEIIRRMKAQMPLKKKITAADFVIDNGGSLMATEKQVRVIWKRLVGA